MRACHLLAAVEWELSQLEGRQEQRAEPQAQHWLAGISGDAGTAEDRGVQAADQEPVCLHPDGEPQHFPGRRLHLWFFSARCEHVALSVSLSLGSSTKEHRLLDAVVSTHKTLWILFFLQEPV
jgi:hypothetical protein